MFCFHNTGYLTTVEQIGKLIFFHSYAVFLAGQYTIGDTDITGYAQSPAGTIQLEDESTLDRYEMNIGLKYFF